MSHLIKKMLPNQVHDPLCVGRKVEAGVGEKCLQLHGSENSDLGLHVLWLSVFFEKNKNKK